MDFFIPSETEYVLDTLNNAGFSAYIVGGCVRDTLLGKTPCDYDVTTSALPCEVTALFRKTADTGISHGTVTVIENKMGIEVTTFRSDGDYTDCRRPDSVSFIADIRTDLARRDFTVNAMAYNRKDGLCDCFGGKSDLENRILRAVGDPEKRFCEDALRILRLFRFASTLGFTSEDFTLRAALEQGYLLEKVSRERIYTELSKAVLGKSVQSLSPLILSGALAFTGISDCRSLTHISRLPENGALRMYAFLKQCGCDTESVLTQLKSGIRIRSYCRLMESLTQKGLPESKTDIKELLNITSLTLFEDWLKYMSIIKNEDTSHCVLMLDEITSGGEPYRIRDLEIGGADIVSLGITGEAAGKTLEALRRHITVCPQDNNRQSLSALAVQLNRN